MALYLVQHGKCMSKDVDPDRPLSDEGRAEVEQVAAQAANYGAAIEVIQHSGKTRAAQTAEIFADHLDPSAGVEALPGLGPIDDVTAWAQSLASDANLMLVGHLPFMERLAAVLLSNQSERPIVRFHNGGIVCLDQEVNSGNWLLHWAIVPRS